MEEAPPEFIRSREPARKTSRSDERVSRHTGLKEAKKGK